MNFPTLYKKTSTGADQEWTISTEGTTIITRWGQCGGAIQEGKDVIKVGKNVGKKNETSAVQQAQLEAEAQWEKKLKKGYVKTLTAARDGEVDEIIEGGVNPMLAHSFDEQGHKIEYPAFVQPKFDGHRCIAVVKDGKATLWTRTRKPITGLPHIIKDIESMCFQALVKNIVLDGELYNHAYKENFEDLTSFIRNPEPKEGYEVVEFHVYDAVSDKLQVDRSLDVLGLISPYDRRGGRYNSIVCVKTITVKNIKELKDAMELFLEQGYEGLMVRNMKAKYENKRSYDLQKYKEFMDAEFQVTGVEEGRGKLAGHAILVCVTAPPIGVEFRVKLKGKTAELAKIFKEPKSVINRMLTVKFQGWTKKNKVPRFPVGLRFRDE